MFALLLLNIKCLGTIKHQVLAPVKFIGTAAGATALEKGLSTVMSLEVRT